MLEKITIVIPTFNRPAYLKRLLRFLNSYGHAFTILILDSGGEKISDREGVSLLSTKNIIRREFESNIFFPLKMAEGLREVKTPFCVLCADDDFVIPESLISCASFLERNEDYSSAMGRVVTHTFPFSWSPVYYGCTGGEEQTPQERLRSYFSGKSAIPFYALHRTEILRSVWEETDSCVSDWGLSELVPCALSLIHGKCKTFPRFFLSRENHVESWYNDDYNRKMYSPEKCDQAVIGIARRLSLRDGIDPRLAEEWVRRELDSFVGSRFGGKGNRSIGPWGRLQSYLSYRIARQKYAECARSEAFQKVKSAVSTDRLESQTAENTRKDYRLL